MRQSLRELYGLQGGLLQQYAVFWKRMALGDFGPSLSAFPTPVSVLIWRALPWTAGLLFFATVLAWCLGNLLGGLAGYFRDSRLLRAGRRRGHGIPSDPLLHRRLRAADRLRLSLAGAADQRRRADEPAARLRRRISSAACCCTPSCRRCRWCWSGSAAGSWGCARWCPTSSPRTTSSTPNSAASSRRRILRSYVMRNALVPQVTGLAMSLGGIFNGAIITEQVFGYPGIGTLLVDAVHAGDYSLVLGHHLGLDRRRRRLGAADRPRLSAARPAREGRLMGARAARPAALQPRVRHRRRPARHRRRDGGAVGILALSAERYLRRAARHAAILGRIRSAPPRAGRTCSGSSPSRSATRCCSACWWRC